MAETTATDQPDPKNCINPATQSLDDKIDYSGGKVDLSTAIRLRLVNGLKYTEIADIFGVTKQAVHHKLRPFIKALRNPGQVGAYQNSRADLFDAAGVKALMAVFDDDKIKKAPLGEVSTAVERFYKLMRLETDQSTENIAQTVKEVISDESLAKLDRIIGGSE
jgi:predicted DNA-binding protein YlxM (UPF0122 family)